jgi:hypothetical protein
VKTSSSTPAASVDLPATFHPVLMDRVVEFIYTGTYADSEFPELRLIQNVTSFPEDSEAVSFARPDLVSAKFHMHMCAVAEELKSPSSYALAHNEMADLVAGQFVLPFRLAELVGAAFAPEDSGLRVCEDKRKRKGKGKSSSTPEGGVQKRTAAKKKLLEKSSAALVSGLERMGVAEDMEL